MTALARHFPFLPRALLLACALAGLGSLVALGFAPCPVATYLHVPCPGCGMTRSVLALLRGDLGGVLRFNPLGPFQLGLSAYIIARSLLFIARDGNLRGLPQAETHNMLRAFFVLQAAQLALWLVRWLGVLGGPCPVG